MTVKHETPEDVATEVRDELETLSQMAAVKGGADVVIGTLKAQIARLDTIARPRETDKAEPEKAELPAHHGLGGKREELEEKQKKGK